MRRAPHRLAGCLCHPLALRTDAPRAFGPTVNSVAVPSMLLPGLMRPVSPAPGRLDALSHVMPLRYLVDAMRDAYAGPYADAATGYGVLVAVGLAALSVTVGTRVFRTAGFSLG